jgi:zona occludens toxin
VLTKISGTPGAGKTLYTIQELLLKQVGSSFRYTTDDGEEREAERVIYTNINGLQLPHEMVENGPGWVQVNGEKGEKVWKLGEGNRLGLHNWHEWAKPGSLIVVDEFQKLWPPRPNGAPIPPDVQALDTHRHMGVDFILITQSKAYDSHISGLIGRHLHLRRVSLLPGALLYEWDYDSRALQYSKAISKKPFRYKRSTYKLYRSAAAHTKQPKAIPPMLFVVVAALAAAAYFVPQTYARIAGKGDQHKANMATLKLPQGAASAPAAAASGAGGVTPLASAGQSPDPSVLRAQAEEQVIGCVKMAARCSCFNAQGKEVQAGPLACETTVPTRPAADVTRLAVQAVQNPVADEERAARDSELSAFARGRVLPDAVSPGQDALFRLGGKSVGAW